ncbi:MAG: HAMP domain-containing protein, partial [Candidatus Acidiferrales bacterium]
MNGLLPRRLVVFLRRASPLDRIALVILILYFLLRLARLAGVAFPHPTLFAFLAILCVIYFIGRLLPWVRGRLMWRLRNRLIVAYIFMAVVPVVLLLTMAGVASYLLYLQLGAHLLHDDLQDRVAMIRTDVESIASAVQQENAVNLRDNPQSALSTASVASVIGALKTQWPDLRIYVNSGNELLKAGDGEEFSGLAEFGRQLAFAAVVRRESRGVPLTILAIAPISTELLDRLPSELGPVQLILMQPASGNRRSGISMEIQDRTYMPQQEISSGKRALSPPENFLDVRVNGASTLEAYPASGAEGESGMPVLASFALRPSAANRRLFSSVGALGPLLSIILIAASAIFLILELFALITGVVLTRTITRAVGDLYDATLHVRRGDFSHRVRVHNRDQLGALGESFNEMTSSITELIEDQRQRQRLENEISIAREVQEQLFPKKLPELPGLALAAVCRAARSVSGDYYDFIRLDENRVGIALADISGKGIFAALLMASLQAALRSQAALDGKVGTAALV